MPLIEEDTPAPSVVHLGTEQLAVNLFDLDRIDPGVVAMLVKPNVDLARESVVRVDPDRLDETAVVFTCPLLHAACVLDTLRNRDRQCGDSPTRAYLRKATVWERLPSSVVLTQVVGGQVRLNPKVFASRVAVSPRRATAVKL